MNLPPPSNLHQPSSTTYLPSLSSSHSPDALQAHSAALQHEVSVQKIALSSLQNEHDKLLAAFSRSQTRASTLEKKHAVSDNEIITLSEEKLRLQAQVIELERDVEELGRSRDEFRQAAVAEGAQYVEIVKKASQLEEMAGEERKSWNKLKAEMEKRIEELSTVNKGREQPIPSQLLQHAIDDIDTPASSVEATTDVKIEPLSETGPTSYPAGSQESISDLKEEIRQLRRRCAEFESVLRAIRDDSHSMEGLVAALGQARTSILDQAERTLESVVEERERSDAIVL
jgi:chromosome segregation ATPase